MANGAGRFVLLLGTVVGLADVIALEARTPRRHLSPGRTQVVARQNLTVDPWGRVVDVEFPEPVELTVPWDRFRFAVDAVQPLTRDGGVCLGDLDGNGVSDLVLGSFNGEALFFPGIQGSSRHFGAGTRLRRRTATLAENPYDIALDANFTSGAIGDLDGDGKAELVTGNRVYSNLAVSGTPLLDLAYTLEGPGTSWDPSSSIGDLDGDGDLDVVVVFGYGEGTYIFQNQSSPGHLSFTRQQVPVGPAALNSRFALADLNGDGLLDLAAADGIYRNTGTRQQPVFDFSVAYAWKLEGGPGSWKATNDLGTSITLIDVTGDGLLDAYISGHDHTFWQVLFYRNVGWGNQPVMRYEGPVTVSSSPVCLYYRGESEPSISGSRAYATAADVDGNGAPDLVLGTDGGDTFGAPGIMFSFPGADGGGPALVYPDIQTFPFMIGGDGYCGSDWYDTPDALCRPPNPTTLVADLSGDGQVDFLHTDSFINYAPKLAVRPRIDSWPFTLGTSVPLTGAGSGTQLSGLGAVRLDGDGDGWPDLVAGHADGTLRFFRSLSSSGAASFSDSVPLTDSAGNPIDVGSQAWPTGFDLDGDGDTDLLVANDKGLIQQVSCLSPGRVNGWKLGGFLGSREQSPVDVQDLVGGGLMAPTLATLDLDRDGLDDVVMGDVQGRLWWLRNVGRLGAPEFSLQPLVANRSAAAWIQHLDSRTVRVRFGVPVQPAITALSFSGLTVGGRVIDGRAIVTPSTPPPPPSLPANCTWHTGTDIHQTLVPVDDPASSMRFEAASMIFVPSGGRITDVDVLSFSGVHEYVHRLGVYLEPPSGLSVTLLDPSDGKCLSGKEWAIDFDDAAEASSPCGPDPAARIRPKQPLSNLNGRSTMGPWTLRLVGETVIPTTGSLNSWGLVLCRAQ